MQPYDAVDAVITWVDGNDKVHVQKLARYCAQKEIVRPESAAPTRFNDRGELTYCVKSLLRFAPWLRTVYIVTDAQTPPIFEELHGTKEGIKLKLIDHRDIFKGFENYLPTFNSISIESLLWQIEGIANHFIYLNDDFSLIQPVSQNDFFRNNKLVLRGTWKVQMEKKWRSYWKNITHTLMKTPPFSIPKNAHRAVQENSAKLAGLSRHFFHLPHTPYPVMKTTFEHYFSKHPELLCENLKYRLRDHKQFWPISLAQHLELQKKNVIFDKALDVVTINGAYHNLEKIKEQLAKADKKHNIPFVCIQSIDEAPELTQKYVFEWLDKKILL